MGDGGSGYHSEYGAEAGTSDLSLTKTKFYQQRTSIESATVYQAIKRDMETYLESSSCGWLKEDCFTSALSVTLNSYDLNCGSLNARKTSVS